MCERPLVPGRLLCRKHLDAQRLRSNARYIGRLASGKCPYCGGIRDDSRYKVCLGCRRYQRQFVKAAP